MCVPPGPSLVDGGERVLPPGPGAGVADLLAQVAREEAAVVGADQVVALPLGDGGLEALPQVRARKAPAPPP
jgi:hypothetical protein